MPASLLSRADEVIELSFRSASIYGAEVTSWVIRVALGALADVRSCPDNDQTGDPPRERQFADGRHSYGAARGYC